MRLSVAGLELLKKLEGFGGRTYLGVHGFSTNGYGQKVFATVERRTRPARSSYVHWG